MKYTTLKDGQWYPWKKDDIHQCCRCRLLHRVEKKVARNGVIWERWTRIEAISPRSSARSLLKHAGKWAGDDLKKCIKKIYKSRGMVQCLERRRKEMRPVHKGEKSCWAIYNLCNDRCDSSKFSMEWKEVTCKKCLVKRRKK